VGSTATPCGQTRVAKGDPVTGVNAPLPSSTANAETLFEAQFGTYTNLPFGGNATPCARYCAGNGDLSKGQTATYVGSEPAGNGDPATGFKAPFGRVEF
jgi:hypothetical protein